MSAATVPAAGETATRETRHEGSGTNHALVQYVSFRVGQQLLGVPVAAVQEVLNPQKIARTPLARAEVAGLLNLRGQIVTAVNLRKRLQLPDAENPEELMNVVLRHEGESFSLLVDRVGDVISVSPDTLTSVPPTLSARWRDVSEGVFVLDDDLFVILNVPAVLSMD